MRHKQEIDFENLNCLQIDLAGQKIDDRDSLKKFLLDCDGNRRWLNNDIYFNLIEKKYENAGKSIRIVSDEECAKCLLKHECCAVMDKDNYWRSLTIFKKNTIGVEKKIRGDTMTFYTIVEEWIEKSPLQFFLNLRRNKFSNQNICNQI